MQRVSPESLAAVVPAGWHDITFGWVLDLDWSNLMPAAVDQIAERRLHDVRSIFHDDACSKACW